jgi:hypothetical protein
VRFGWRGSLAVEGEFRGKWQRRGGPARTNGFCILPTGNDDSHAHEARRIGSRPEWGRLFFCAHSTKRGLPSECLSLFSKMALGRYPVSLGSRAAIDYNRAVFYCLTPATLCLLRSPR